MKINSRGIINTTILATCSTFMEISEYMSLRARISQVRWLMLLFPQKGNAIVRTVFTKAFTQPVFQHHAAVCTNSTLFMMMRYHMLVIGHHTQEDTLLMYNRCIRMRGLQGGNTGGLEDENLGYRC